MTSTASRCNLHLLLLLATLILPALAESDHKHDHTHAPGDDVMQGLSISPRGIIEANDGDTAIFTCRSHDDTHLTWMMNGHELTSGGDVKITHQVDVTDHVRTSTLRMVIHHRGVIRCVDEDNHADVVTVTIVEEDHVHEHDHDSADHGHDQEDNHDDHQHLEISPKGAVDLPEGGTLRIECVCHDGTNVTWTRGEQILTSGVNGVSIATSMVEHTQTSTLVIEAASVADSGKYTCYDNDDHDVGKGVDVRVLKELSAGADTLQHELLGTLACCILSLLFS